MPNQYKIPQNIDVEDKIVGPFTLKQFLYMLGGGVTIYFLFLTLPPISFALFFAVSIPIALFTITLVFIKVNERPFLVFLQYFFQFVFEPKVQRWKKSTKVKRIMMEGREEYEKGRAQSKARADKGEIKSRLAELSLVIDTKGWSGEEGGFDMGGRATSSDQVRSAVQTTIEDEPLEDVFADLETAMENITKKQVKTSAKAEQEVEDKGASELAAKLSELISKR